MSVETNEQILIPAKEFAKLAETLTLLKGCCDESKGLLQDCKNLVILKNDAISLSGLAIKACEADAKVLFDKNVVLEKTLADRESNTWISVAWDWFWPILAIGLGGYVAGDILSH